MAAYVLAAAAVPNRAAASSLAAAAILAVPSRSARTASTVRARASGRPGGKVRPVRPSATTSSRPPEAAATTGAPDSWASTATRPRPSSRPGTSSAAARR